MQQKWFQSINNEFNFYFIIHYEGKRIGLINFKNIDWEKNISESGLFIWDPNYDDSPAPLLASLLVSEFGFGVLNGGKSFIRIVKGNRKAIDFNTSIGFEPVGPPDHNDLQFYVQTKESFYEKTQKMRKAALIVSGSSENIIFQFEPHDYNSIAPLLFKYLKEINHPYDIIKEGTKEIYSILPKF
jgi:hypothetical protein